MSDRFSTNFIDLSPPQVTLLQGSASSDLTGETAPVETAMATTTTEDVGFADSFVEQPTLDTLGSQGSTGTPPNRFSDSFTGSDLQLEQAHMPAFETRDSPTSSQEDLSQGSHSTAKSGEESPAKGGHAHAKEGHAQAVTVAAEVNQKTEPGEHPQVNGVEPGGAGGHPVVNGVSEREVSPEIAPAAKTAEKWERFEEASATASAKSIQKRLSGSPARDDHGAVCAADAVVSSQWTALGDSRHDVVEEAYDTDQNLPFRKTQSMRATTHRKVQIVDALRQRRLSNSSLDRYPLGQSSQFDNQDDITRKFNVTRDWQVFVKMDRRVKGTRSKWLPVNISVKDGILLIKRSTPPNMPAISSTTAVAPDALPLHEIRLLHNHFMSPPVSRRYDRKTKLHQIKLRQSRVHERRTFKRWLFVDHVSSAHTIVKIGCPDLNIVDSLTDQINEAIRQLPVTREQGIAYRMSEVFVDVKDQSEILMNCDGAVLERSSLNRIYLQAFLTGTPECRLVLNDIEAILLQGKGQMTTSMTRQVKLANVVLHPCIDTDAYKARREVVFHPVDGYSFELLRCSIEPYVSPPVNVSALMEYSEERNTVRITASFSVRKKLNIQLRPITNLIIKFPIPSSWSPLFLAESRFGGKKSVRSTSALRGSFRRKIRSGDCQIETEMGSAKYEPEHGAILWRIGHYSRSTVQHTFRCDVQLKSGMHKPDILQQHAEVTYSLPGSSTGLQVRALKVDDQSPERWVKYEILYHYQVQMFPDLSMD